ncbi:MAG TPA: CDP-alcohol phosphatidyltransferase family protein [Roseimicrobium sp.]|nr:CDP-alcohol phosphatidyltransferase family protein [Roseimicrobium sp.]
MENVTRRPISARDTRWAGTIARTLANAGIQPNQISIASVLCAAISGSLFWLSSEAGSATVPWLFLSGAAFVQLRLLCNMFDGMVAVEGGLRTKSGEIYNELPDRFADTFILVGVGYAAFSPFWAEQAGWAAAVFALITAYTRALGASAGAAQQFCGPMAKQHRMAVITVAAVGSAILCWCGIRTSVLPHALLIISAGCLITIFRRTSRIIRELESK